MARRQFIQALGAGVFAVLLITAAGSGVAQETSQPDETPTEQPESGPESDNTTSVRVVHVSPVVPPVNVSVEDQSVAENASFGAVGNYQTVEAGEVEVEFVNAGTDDELAESDVTLEPDSAYTVLIVGEQNDSTVQFDPIILQDTIAIPAESNASFRFVHGSPNMPAVDVTVADSNRTLAENVTFRQDGPYVSVPAGNVTVEIREATADSSGTVLARSNLSLANRSANTVYAFDSGETDTQNETSIAVGISEDARAETNGTS